jgi:hypothetical protein
MAAVGTGSGIARVPRVAALPSDLACRGLPDRNHRVAILETARHTIKSLLVEPVVVGKGLALRRPHFFLPTPGCDSYISGPVPVK